MPPTRAPLLYWSIADVLAEEKLARMREALEGGSDPNEMDGSTDPKQKRGRPLNMCLDAGKALEDTSRLNDNAPVLQLLLEWGADPRLYGVPENPHMPGYLKRPVDGVKSSLEHIRQYEGMHYARCEVKYYEDAYKLMKEASDPLNGQKDSICSLQ